MANLQDLSTYEKEISRTSSPNRNYDINDSRDCGDLDQLCMAVGHLVSLELIHQTDQTYWLTEQGETVRGL